MPTRVPVPTPHTMVDEDAKSEAGRSVSSASSGSRDENVNVGNNSDVLHNDIYVNNATCEPGELRTRSPAEPGEVIRKENGEDAKAKFVPKFSMSSPEKQVSVMQSLFSSFLPPNTDNQGSAFWSNFIQQTAAAAAAQSAVANQELNIEDDSENESNSEVKAEDKMREKKYMCTIEECSSSFATVESRDLHSRNIKLHCKMFENNQTVDTDASVRQLRHCPFCDKSFHADEALAAHMHTVHQGQESMFNDKNFSSQLDSIKSKTPVIA